MAHVVDVAAYILEDLGSVSTMKLQKLAFYSQAYYLAEHGATLFPEAFEAWANGPVAPDLFRRHRGEFVIARGFFGPVKMCIRDRPNISTIVTVDPYWTWTAKYSDYVLPACNYWEKWDFLDRSPWVFFQSPAVTPAGESKSDVEIMSLLAAKVGLGDLWNKTDEEWVRSFVNEEHPAWEGFDFDKAVEEGIWGLSLIHIWLMLMKFEFANHMKSMGLGCLVMIWS